jgi:hypothetical protein
MQNDSKRGGFAPLFDEKCRKIALFCKNIWSYQKNVVPLHRFSADVLKVVAKSDRDPPL